MRMNIMVDKEKIRKAVRLLLEGIGEDADREGLKDTPDRVARMYEEIFGGMDEEPEEHLLKTFTADSSDMVVEKDITMGIYYDVLQQRVTGFHFFL